MKKLIVVILFGLMGLSSVFADVPIYSRVIGTDTTLIAYLREVYVYPPMKFKNARQERFYWKTVRDVKKTLPYAKMAGKIMNDADKVLQTLSTEEEKKAYLQQTEKALVSKFEKDIRNMTRSQGKMLIKLIDRECSLTSYQIIELYRGKVAAIFWQGIAKLFGANLKDDYDGKDKDQIVERIITLVEAGQL